ncbi:MAG: CinA family nicotinamide mononucleotide deamidase-related protein [Bacteroidales bacterium]
MKAAILSIGDEILIGQTINTNASYIAQELNQAGISITEVRTIADNSEAIQLSLNNLFLQVDLVISTGGLGPTKDDITKISLAEYFGSHQMQLHYPSLQHIKSLLKSRGITMNALNKEQAVVPNNCKVLHNALGTAPAMWFEKAEKVLIALPGVPYEMEALIHSQVLPALQQRFIFLPNFHQHITTSGIAESMLAELLQDWESSLPSHFSLAYLPSFQGVRLRLSSYNVKELEKVQAESELLVHRLQEIIPEYIVSFDQAPLEQTIGKLLTQKKASVSTAESCTGGHIASLLTSIAGASTYFMGSVIAYSNTIKFNELRVNPLDLEMHGAVSQPVVEQMARGAQQKFMTNYAIATSGIAGPSGGTLQKPVGTVWIAIASPTKVVSTQLSLGNERNRIVMRATAQALNLLRKVILLEK